MKGVGMPGHFLIRPAIDEMTIYVDPFNRGEILFEADCQEKLKQLYGPHVPWRPEFLEPVTARPFLLRLLTNLKLIYLNQRHLQKAVSVIDRLLLIDPERLQEYRDRGLAYYQLNQAAAARKDLEYYLLRHPDPPDAAAIQQLLEQIAG
jgi:regulator of sirC expression with transglutaminase-like and TPR domain